MLGAKIFGWLFILALLVFCYAVYVVYDNLMDD